MLTPEPLCWTTICSAASVPKQCISTDENADCKSSRDSDAGCDAQGCVSKRMGIKERSTLLRDLGWVMFAGFVCGRQDSSHSEEMCWQNTSFFKCSTSTHGGFWKLPILVSGNHSNQDGDLAPLNAVFRF